VVFLLFVIVLFSFEFLLILVFVVLNRCLYRLLLFIYLAFILRMCVSEELKIFSTNSKRVDIIAEPSDESFSEMSWKLLLREIPPVPREDPCKAELSTISRFLQVPSCQKKKPFSSYHNVNLCWTSFQMCTFLLSGM
jgi:hypothetical protein